MKLYSDRIVLKDSIVEGYIEIKGERIKAVHVGKEPDKNFMDFRGKYIMPGMINMQSQNLALEEDNFYFSRYPRLKEFIHVERLQAMSGVTTVYHSIDIDKNLRENSLDVLMNRLRCLRKYYDKDYLIDHKIHLKFKVGSIQNIELINQLLKQRLIDMATYVEGIENGIDYYKDDYFLDHLKTELDIEGTLALEILDRIKERRMQIHREDMSYNLKDIKKENIPVGTTRYKLAESMEKQYRTEIPIILDPNKPEALDYAQRTHKYATLDIDNLWDSDKMNCYAEGVLNRQFQILTASKRPQNLLESIFEIAMESSLIDAVRMVTHNPAKALGLYDKGSIEEGKYADLIVVNSNNFIPVNLMTVSKGRVVMEVNYDSGQNSQTCQLY